MVARTLAAVVTLVATASAGDLYVLHLPDGSLNCLTEGSGRMYGSPQWSRDGQQILLDSWPEGEATLLDATVTLLDLRSGELTLLGPGAMPSWSPDESQLVCHTYNPHLIVVMNADGTGRETLLEQWGCPRWSPDGASILTVRNDGLARYDLATGKQHWITRGVFARPGFDYSPVSDRIVTPTSDSRLLVIDRPLEANGATNVRERYTRFGRVGHVSWAPDGKRFVAGLGEVGHRSDDAAGLWVFDADGNVPPERLEGPPEDWTCCNPRWSHDGTAIAFVRTDTDPPPEPRR